MSQDASTSDALDLGGCEGCALGCAVACADGREDRATAARRVLVGSGVGVLLLSLGPGLVARHAVVLVVGVVGTVLGALVALLAAIALVAGRPAGDRYARLAFRLLPPGIAGMLLTGIGAVLTRLW
jgi:hypothetical protein